MAKRQELQDRRRRAARRQRIAVVAVIAAVIIIVGAVFLIENRQNNQSVGSFVQITPVAYPDATGRQMGNPNAPVVMQEFADFQCPYCGEFARTTQQQVVDQFVDTGKVLFIFHNFPLPSLEPESGDAALAAMCAIDQNQFWRYHDMLYANQTGENVGDFTSSRLIAFAGALGMDKTSFSECLDSKKYQSQIDQDVALGNSLGVQSTPTFDINGKLVEGAEPIDVFAQAIDQALAAKGK
ncbi:MAG: DsbA family protein [Anaerolineales bacterium]|jgi:protein-disulfide isomerase